MTIAILLTPCGDGQPSSFLCVSFCAGQGFLDFLATSHEESVCCGFNFPIAGEAMHACSMAIERRPVVTQGEGGGLGSAPGPPRPGRCCVSDQGSPWSPVRGPVDVVCLSSARKALTFLLIIALATHDWLTMHQALYLVRPYLIHLEMLVFIILFC